VVQKKFHNAGDDWLQKAEKEQPFGRLVKPAEVAEFAAFIVSERSGLMTGSIIDFDQSVNGTHE
jgi:NAD(P)-dependent dehydrogenase (short-subunit alcohol dehydrogenase family)